MTAQRHAVYFAPAPASLLWRRGSQWLGRCALEGAVLPQPGVPGLTAQEFWLLTEAPRRYGWHATLKAPFELAPGQTSSDLQTALRRLCAQFGPCTLPPLKVTQLGDFLALVPDGDDEAVRQLAAACVQELHPLAAPLRPQELLRRRQAGLSEREDALLIRWGYPHVLDRFRFHFSLTGPLTGITDDSRHALTEFASIWFGGATRCRIDALSLFMQPHPGADFRWISREELSA